MIASFALVVCAAVTLGVGNPSRAAAPHDTAATAQPPALWFFDKGFALDLRTPDGATKTLSSYGGLPPQVSPVSSELAYTASVSSGRQRVTTVDPDGSELDAFTCQCAGNAVWVADGAELAVLDNHSLVLRDVAAHTTNTLSLSGDTNFHNENAITAAPAALAGVAGGLVFSAATVNGTSAYGGPVTLFRSSLTGHVTRLHAAGGNVEVDGAAIASADQKSVAYVIGYHGGACADNAAIGILNPATGHLSKVSFPKLNRPWAVTGFRYRGNHLYVGLAATPKKCASGVAYKAEKAAPTLYQVKAGRLARVATSISDQATADGWTAVKRGRVSVNPEGGAKPSTITISSPGGNAITVPKAYEFGWL